MSEIPYYFETPIPKYFRENGWFNNPNTILFVTWSFSKCSCFPRTVVFDGKEITLAPYEFITGRGTTSEACHLTNEALRHQLNHLLKSGLLKKTPNSTPNRFTCYIWVTDRFSNFNTNSTPNKQPTEPPTEPPQTKRKDDKNEKNEDIAKTFGHCGNVHNSDPKSDFSPFTHENTSLAAPPFDPYKQVSEFKYPNGKCVVEKTLVRWFKTYSTDEIRSALSYTVKMSIRKSIPNLEGYTETALKFRHWETHEMRIKAAGREEQAKKDKENHNVF